MSTDSGRLPLHTIFLRFLYLGCVCFGGPIAHIGYYQKEIVERLQWISPQRFAGMLALAQFLPGPASSQMVCAIGHDKGGLPGALAAFIAFTLPSFIIMYLVAVFSKNLLSDDIYTGVVHGLKLLAVIVVADAVVTMFLKFCMTRIKFVVFLITLVVLLLVDIFYVQFGCLLVAAIVGATLKTERHEAATQTGAFQYGYLILFAILGISLAVWSGWNSQLHMVNGFYQAGSWVFGGGHVVLPLLQGFFGEVMPADDFLAGYAAAQALPGPVFTIASYMGALLVPDSPFFGALLATLAIFTPGFLLMLGFLGNLGYLQSKPRINGALQYVNASVVGLLAAAWFDPVMISTVHNRYEFLLVVAGFAILRLFNVNTLYLVIAFVAIGIGVNGVV